MISITIQYIEGDETKEANHFIDPSKATFGEFLFMAECLQTNTELWDVCKITSLLTNITDYPPESIELLRKQVVFEILNIAYNELDPSYKLKDSKTSVADYQYNKYGEGESFIELLGIKYRRNYKLPNNLAGIDEYGINCTLGEFATVQQYIEQLEHIPHPIHYMLWVAACFFKEVKNEQPVNLPFNPCKDYPKAYVIERAKLFEQLPFITIMQCWNYFIKFQEQINSFYKSIVPPNTRGDLSHRIKQKEWNDKVWQQYGWDLTITNVANLGIFNKPNQTPYESAFNADLREALNAANINNAAKHIIT